MIVFDQSRVTAATGLGKGNSGFDALGKIGVLAIPPDSGITVIRGLYFQVKPNGTQEPDK